MVLKSYAKINLSLSVTKKLRNGLHDIQSIFCLINFYDIINIKKIKKHKKDRISFYGPYSKNVNKNNNSVVKILDLLRKHKVISDYYSIKINKKIPVFAGLGGGTSNAVTIFNFLVNKKINKKLLEKILNQVGTDSRLFFQKQGYLKDINTVVKFKRRYNLNFLLAFPLVKCSTKKVYSKVKRYSKKATFSFHNFTKKKRFIKLLIVSKNDLQSIVEKQYPIIRKLVSDIDNNNGCYLSRMTGSGSSCYGLFVDNRSAKAALKKLEKKYPKFWFSIAKTF